LESASDGGGWALVESAVGKRIGRGIEDAHEKGPFGKMQMMMDCGDGEVILRRSNHRTMAGAEKSKPAPRPHVQPTGTGYELTTDTL
jgi:hypothetical protein